MISRVQSELTDAAINQIESTVVSWREGSSTYQDIAGFCRSVSLKEIAEHGHVLTPGRYVGSQEVDDDDEVFSEKMQRLTVQLAEQMANSAELDSLIHKNLKRIGYEL